MTKGMMRNDDVPVGRISSLSLAIFSPSVIRKKWRERGLSQGGERRGRRWSCGRRKRDWSGIRRGLRAEYRDGLKRPVCTVSSGFGLGEAWSME